MNYELDFTIHQHESNHESQAILDNNKIRFTADCKRVYDLLMTGQKFTVKELDCDRARLSDLKRMGFRFSNYLNEDRYKTWFATNEDIEFNRNKFK